MRKPSRKLTLTLTSFFVSGDDKSLTDAGEHRREYYFSERILKKVTAIIKKIFLFTLLIINIA